MKMQLLVIISIAASLDKVSGTPSRGSSDPLVLQTPAETSLEKCA